MSSRFARRALWLLILLCGIAGRATAQELYGRVTEADGRPVVGAHLRLTPLARPDRSLGAVTDSKGHYSLRLSAGDYRVQVSYVGFRDEERSVTLQGKRLRVDFTLREDRKLLDEVVVLGTTHRGAMRRQALSAVSLDVSSVLSSLSRLDDLVSRTSGVHLREEGGLGSAAELTINGLGGQAVRYFIDGVPLSSRGSSVTLQTLPTNIVDRVEIYKGVVPPELGMDALGGAVNIVTKRSRESFLDASVRGGSFHTLAADLHGQYRHPASGLTLRPTLSLQTSRNDYIMRDAEVWDEERQDLVRRDVRRFHDGYRSLTAGLQLGVTHMPWADEALLGADFTGSEKEIQTGFYQKWVVGEATRRRSDLSVTAHYTKQDLLTEGLSLRLDAGFARDHILLADTAFRHYSWDGTFLETNHGEVLKREKALRHTLRPGLSLRLNLSYDSGKWGALNLNYQLSALRNHRYDDLDDTFDESRDRMTRHIMGLSYGGDLLGGRLHLMGFLKDYLYTVSIGQSDLPWLTGAEEAASHSARNHLGGGLGLRYAPLEALAVKGSYEYATQLPSARQLMGNGMTIYPNFKLRPERAHNVNIGLYGQTPARGDHYLEYEGTFFYRDVHDFFHRVIVSDVESQYVNIGTTRIMGVEGEVKYSYRSLLDLTLNGTCSDERDRTPSDLYGRPNATFGCRIPNRPWLYGNLMAGMTLREPFGVDRSKLRLDLAVGYIRWFYRDWAAFGSRESKAVIPSQYNLSGGVTWSFHHSRYSVSLQGDNLLDRPLYDNYMLQKPGRSLFCKVRVFIN